MKSKQEIKAKLQEFETQKEQIISIIEGDKDVFFDLIEAVKLLDKNIGLLKWVLNK